MATHLAFPGTENKSNENLNNNYFLLVSSMLSTTFAGQEQKFRSPPDDMGLWRNSFYVLLEVDASAKKTRKTIEKIIAKEAVDMPLGVFKKHSPLSVSTILPFDTRNRSSKTKEDARSKLGRYLIVNYPDGIDLQVVFEELKKDPDVSYFGVDSLIMIDIGAQIIYFSSGVPEVDNNASSDVNASFCPVGSNDAHCLVLNYAQDREVMLVASASNY